MLILLAISSFAFLLFVDSLLSTSVLSNSLILFLYYSFFHIRFVPKLVADYHYTNMITFHVINLPPTIIFFYYYYLPQLIISHCSPSISWFIHECREIFPFLNTDLFIKPWKLILLNTFTCDHIYSCIYWFHISNYGFLKICYSCLYSPICAIGA